MQQNSTQSTHPTTNFTQPIQSTKPLPQYIPMQQEKILNTFASIPEPMEPSDGLDHLYTTVKYLQHVEARLTFDTGEEPQNSPIK